MAAPEFTREHPQRNPAPSLLNCSAPPTEPPDKPEPQCPSSRSAEASSHPGWDCRLEMRGLPFLHPSPAVSGSVQKVSTYSQLLLPKKGKKNKTFMVSRKLTTTLEKLENVIDVLISLNIQQRPGASNLSHVFWSLWKWASLGTCWGLAVFVLRPLQASWKESSFISLYSQE